MTYHHAEDDGEEEPDVDPELIECIKTAVELFQKETMPKVVEECLNFSEILINSLPHIVVNEDLLLGLILMFLKLLSSPKEQIAIQANSLVNLC